MISFHPLAISVLVLSSITTCSATEEEFSNRNDVEQVDGSLRAQRLIGNIVTSTTTVLSVSTVMTTVPVSCLVNTLPATSCRRRRRRRKAEDMQQHETELAAPSSDSIHQLESSMKSSSAVSQVNPAARIFLYATRYITINSVVTSYTTITDESTTVSLSLLCTVAGQFLNARRCWLTIMPA